jgi:hypothetical protein
MLPWAAEKGRRRMKSVSANIRFVRFPESVPGIENLTVMPAESGRGMQAKPHMVKVLRTD